MSFNATRAIEFLACVSMALGCDSAARGTTPALHPPAAAGSGGSHDDEPVGPEILGWAAPLDGATCRHPLVQESCNGGWCRIPAGCFIMGSPEGEFGRGLKDETLTAVTLTHPFEIMQTELTQGSLKGPNSESAAAFRRLGIDYGVSNEL